MRSGGGFRASSIVKIGGMVRGKTRGNGAQWCKMGRDLSIICVKRETTKPEARVWCARFAPAVRPRSQDCPGLGSGQVIGAAQYENAKNAKASVPMEKCPGALSCGWRGS
jgi:hypothetical protein